ncbi:hypothetical protein [Streptomyces graminilatus]|uniref:hypothetical protein n=1 Tax=Streptomyces graminilatus TaxID=1464070 RepID=UPI0006E2242A|nr:hypothetical protein [Streptomyces graminilatus]
MKQQEAVQGPSAETDDEAAWVVRGYDALLDECDMDIANLREALRQKIDKREDLAAARDDAAKLINVGPRLERLRQIAVDMLGPLDDLDVDSFVAGEPVPRPALDKVPIRTTGQRDLLAVIGSRAELWCSEQLATALGIPLRDAKARKGLRNRLASLVGKGVLERVDTDSTRAAGRVFYRLRATWEYAGPDGTP